MLALVLDELQVFRCKRVDEGDGYGHCFAQGERVGGAQLAGQVDRCSRHRAEDAVGRGRSCQNGRIGSVGLAMDHPGLAGQAETPEGAPFRGGIVDQLQEKLCGGQGSHGMLFDRSFAKVDNHAVGSEGRGNFTSIKAGSAIDQLVEDGQHLIGHGSVNATQQTVGVIQCDMDMTAGSRAAGRRGGGGRGGSRRAACRWRRACRTRRRRCPSCRLGGCTRHEQHARQQHQVQHGRQADVVETGAQDVALGWNQQAQVDLAKRLLLPLLERGLSVRDRHEVQDICQTSQGFRLSVMDHKHNRIRTLLARRVVLAAGTLNTLRLLFASRARGSLNGMPALGQGIGGNGDVPAYWACNENGRDFSLGTPCHGRFALDDEATDLTRYGLNGVDRIPMPPMLRARLKRDLVLVGMGADSADGIARWRHGKLSLQYRQQNSPVLADIYRAFDRISALSGKKVYFLRSRPMTVHPFGGARLGQNSASSVINARGEVHDIPGLFVADGSALPAAPGVPPSMTIAAWAGHVAAQLASSSLSSEQEVA